MTKGDQIIEMIGEVAVQATQQVIDAEKRVTSAIEKIDLKIDEKISEMKNEMRELRNENSKFHDELVGYFKHVGQEMAFTSEHLRRHDGEIMELQKTAGIR